MGLEYDATKPFFFFSASVRRARAEAGGECGKSPKSKEAQWSWFNRTYRAVTGVDPSLDHIAMGVQEVEVAAGIGAQHVLT